MPAVTTVLPTIRCTDVPERLQRLAHPPHELYVIGTGFEAMLERPRVAIVGSRKVSGYGRTVTDRLAGELAGLGVVIISGLALGVDGVAHEAALAAGGLTLACMPGGLDKIYPASHRGLAQRIVSGGGVLLSEYAAGSIAHKQNFIARNRIVAGLADALLITEAAEQSGTLHTARFALEQGIDVLAVPGNITSPTSAGTNNLLKSGAQAVTSTADVLDALGLTNVSADTKRQRIKGGNDSEQRLIDLLEQGTSESSLLLAASGLSLADFNHHLTMLEISGKIRSRGNNHWSLA